MSNFKGRTEDAKSAPFMGADSWRKGTKVIGKVARAFKSANGPCVVLEVAQPIELDGKPEKHVSLGGLKGLEMALQAAGLSGLEGLRVGDRVYIECTGSVGTTNGHNRVNFSVEINRPDSLAPEGADDDVAF